MLLVTLKENINSKNFLEEVFGLLSLSKGYKGLYVDNEGDIAYKMYECDTDSSGAIYNYLDNHSHKAWIRYIKTEKNLVYFGIVTSKKYKLTKGNYAFYHTLFTDFLLNFFDAQMEEIKISSKFNKDIDIF